jgi:hypothetical protein
MEILKKDQPVRVVEQVHCPAEECRVLNQGLPKALKSWDN